MLFVICSCEVHARLLNHEIRYITDNSGEVVHGLADNNLESFKVLQHLEDNNPYILIDLGRDFFIHQVYFTGSAPKFSIWTDPNKKKQYPPKGCVQVSVGSSLGSQKKITQYLLPYNAGEPVDVEATIRFPLSKGRYVKIELLPADLYSKKGWWDSNWASHYPPEITKWKIAEVEIRGVEASADHAVSEAVVSPEIESETLQLAASELSYYLTELLGRPVPVIGSNQQNTAKGTLFVLEDLQKLAPDFEEMVKNYQDKKIPNGINVEKSGKKIIFRSWPYYEVLRGVWAFLDRQGVVWTSPEGHGEFIPEKNSIETKFLPISGEDFPSRMYANWDTSALLPHQLGDQKNYSQEYLNIWRNGWTGSWDTPSFLKSPEIPKRKISRSDLPEEYAEGFEGYPHNFSSVLPDRILGRNPQWCGYVPGVNKRICPPEKDAPTFDMTNLNAVQWVADKMIHVDQATTLYPSEFNFRKNQLANKFLYNLLPNDSTSYDQSAQSQNLNAPLRKRDGSNGLYETYQSGGYFYFVQEVAARIGRLNSKIQVGALAYADVWEHPEWLEKLPENVQVEVCMYGAPNLLMDADCNKKQKEVFQSWRKRAKTLHTYDYSLLHTDLYQPDPQVPAMMIKGIIDRAKFLHRIGALDGGCQATLESIPYNPWNYWVYPYIRLHITDSEKEIKSKFFRAYYQEASKPLLELYDLIENYQVSNQVDIRNFHNFFCFGLGPGAYPSLILKKAEMLLGQAEKLSQKWFIKKRVQSIRESLTWVKEKLQITDDEANLPQQVASKQTRISLHRAKKVFLGGWGNYAELHEEKNEILWHFPAQGAIKLPLKFAKTGRYRVDISARTLSTTGSEWPCLVCYIGSKKIGQINLSSNEAKTYSIFPVVIEKYQPAQELWIEYSNAAPGGARSFCLSDIIITRIE